MKCKNCQAENPDNAIFCGSCGSKMPQATPVSQATPVPQSAPETIQATKPVVPQPNAETVKAKKKKSKLPIILVVLILIAALGVTGYVFGKDMVLSMFKSPEERLIDGLFDSMEARSGEIYTSIELEDLELTTSDPESDASFEDLLKNMKIESMIRFDQEKRQFEGDLNLRLMGTSLVSADYYMTDEYLIVDVPLLYDQPMYWDLYTLLASLQEGVSDGSFEAQLGMFATSDFGLESEIDRNVYIDFERLDESYDNYKDMLDRDTYKSYDAIDWSDYKAIMVPYIEEHLDDIEDDEFEMDFDSDVSYKGSRYSVEYDYEESSELMKSLVEVLAEDDHIKVFLEEIVTMLIDRVIENEDYTMYALLLEEPMDDIEEWDGDFQDDLEDLQEDMFDDIEDAFDDLEDSVDDAEDQVISSQDLDIEELMDAMDIEMTLDLDEEGYFRSQIISVEGSLGEGGEIDLMSPSLDFIEFIGFNIVNEFNLLDQEVEFDGIDKEDAIDIGRMNEEEMDEFEGQIQMHLFEALQNNPAFSGLMGY